MSQDASIIEAMFEGSAHIQNNGLSKQELSLFQAVSLNGIMELTSPYIVLRLIKIVRGYRDLIETQVKRIQLMSQSCGDNQAIVPYMGEFFMIASYDDKTVLRKRDWHRL